MQARSSIPTLIESVFVAKMTGNTVRFAADLVR
jgi:hypothetical protein